MLCDGFGGGGAGRENEESRWLHSDGGMYAPGGVYKLSGEEEDAYLLPKG